MQYSDQYLSITVYSFKFIDNIKTPMIYAGRDRSTQSWLVMVNLFHVYDQSMTMLISILTTVEQVW